MNSCGCQIGDNRGNLNARRSLGEGITLFEKDTGISCNASASVMSKCPQHFLRWISTPVFSKISLSGLVFDEVATLFCSVLRLLFVQKPPRTQALPLPDADSAVRFDMNGCLESRQD